MAPGPGVHPPSHQGPLSASGEGATNYTRPTRAPDLRSWALVEALLGSASAEELESVEIRLQLLGDRDEGVPVIALGLGWTEELHPNS